MIKYNVKEFAELIGVSRRTLHRYIKKGIIVPRKSFSGKKFFVKEDLKQIKNQEIELCEQNIHQ